MLRRVLKAVLSRQAKEKRVDPESELHSLRQERRADEALARCDAMLAERPDAARLHLFRGRVLFELSRLDESERAAQEALRRGDVSGEADLLLSEVLSGLGRPKEALDSAERARLRMPNSAEVWTQYGLINLRVGNVDRAHHAFMRALQIDRSWVPAWVNRAVAERTLGQVELARASLREAITLAPNSGVAWSNYALALRDGNRLDEALDAIQRAARLRPGHGATALNEGAILLDAGRLSDSLRAYERALASKPELVDAAVGIALVRHRLGEHARAVTDLEALLASYPDASLARAALGELQLWHGDFAQGWDNWESRLLSTETAVNWMPLPVWGGEPLPPGRLLVQAEQGLGDMILFASCFGDVLERASEPVIQVPEKLLGLMARSFPSAHVYPASSRFIPEFVDRHAALSYRVPAGSLMRLFRRSRDAFSQGVAYLRADPDRVRRWRDRVAQLGKGPVLGLSWEGGVDRTGRRDRSIPLAAWRPLIQGGTGTSFVSLQYTKGAATQVEAVNGLDGVRLHHFPDALDDYEETAALVSVLDGVVTVCTAVAHLAGALGIPCLVVAPEVPTWRYHAGGPPPWYASLRVVCRPSGLDHVAYLRHIATIAEREFPAWRLSPLGAAWSSCPYDAAVPNSGDPTKSPVAPSAGSEVLSDSGGTAIDKHLASADRYSSELAWDEADAEARCALALDPSRARAWLIRARASAVFGERSDAHGFLDQAVKCAPSDPEILEEWARSLYLEERYDDAIDAARRALAVEPDRVGALFILGLCLCGVDAPEEALSCVQRCIELEPGAPQFFRHLANVLFDLGRFEEAGRLWLWLLAREPEDVPARWSLARLQLSRRQFEVGWANYRVRHAAVEVIRLSAQLPRWQGEPLAGKRLLVAGEQGLGDEIMFASCYPDLVAMGAQLILRCDRRLIGLFQRAFPDADVGPREDPALVRGINADLEVSAGDLPALLRSSESSFPAHLGYLRADPARVAYWRERLLAKGNAVFVGISWRGGIPSTRSKARSLPVDAFAALLVHPSIILVSLQYGECKDEIASFEQAHPGRIVHFPDAIADYEETAALICALERVVTVCTAIVHLTGALGRPVDVLVPYIPEWRYGIAEGGMVWYPTATLLRQRVRGSWTEPMAAAAARLGNAQSG